MTSHFCWKFPSFLFPSVGRRHRRLLLYLSRWVHPKKSRHITERRCAFTESPARWWPLTCASRPTTSHPPSANEFLSTSTVSLNISDWILSLPLLFYPPVSPTCMYIRMMRIIEINRERLVHHHSRSGARFHKTLPNSRPRSTDHHYLQSLLHIQTTELVNGIIYPWRCSISPYI
jgi:hypothetical protein